MCIDTLLEVLEKISLNELTKKLNVSKSTISRWIKTKKVPDLYILDLLRINKTDIDYSKYNFKQKDQYFTPRDTAFYCFSKFKNIIEDFENEESYFYIEPSAGSGSFLDVLPNDRTLSFDIEPKDERIIKQDYLVWVPDDDKKYIVFGNPPFGLRGHLALKFINHSYDFADYVCFILPQLFESDGKGVPRKRVKGYNLLHSEKLNTHFIDPDNNKLKVNCVFQIWSKHNKSDKFDIKNTTNNILKIYSLSDGGTPSSTRNKDMLRKCDIYIPSTCFGEKNMKWYSTFDDLPSKKGYGIIFLLDKNENINKFKNIEWNKISFLSTNSAYNIRSSQIIDAFINIPTSL
jgi:transcriptional regulator with XRE-family HTH domain